MAVRQSDVDSRAVQRGEYTPAFLATEQARYQFLQAVRRRCPLPLLHLRRRIYPLYSRWADEFIADARAEHEWTQSAEAAQLRAKSIDVFTDLMGNEKAAEFAVKVRPVMGVNADDAVFNTFMILEYYEPRLSRLLMRWAQRHNLTHQRAFEEESPKPDVTEDETQIPACIEMTWHKDYWACEWAFFTLWSWKFLPEAPQMMNANPPKWVRAFENRSPASDEPPFRVRPGWDVLSEAEPVFRERAEKALTTYISIQRRLAEARGLIVTAEKRRPIHFDWLALYQVKRLSWPQVADWDSQQPGARTMGADTIKKGALAAASLCWLSARITPPGRPKTLK